MSTQQNGYLAPTMSQELGLWYSSGEERSI